MKYRIVEQNKGTSVVTPHRNLWDKATAEGFCQYLQRHHTHCLFWLVAVEIGSQSVDRQQATDKSSTLDG